MVNCDQVSPLIYVVTGAAIGFLGNYLLERMKRQYELKKATYFEALDILTRGPRIHDVNKSMQEIYKKHKDDMAQMTKPYQDSNIKDEAKLIYLNSISKYYAENVAPHENVFIEWLSKFQAVDLKLEICGSKEVKDIVTKYFVAICKQEPTESINIELIKVMREELLKHWWKASMAIYM